MNSHDRDAAMHELKEMQVSMIQAEIEQCITSMAEFDALRAQIENDIKDNRFDLEFHYEDIEIYEMIRNSCNEEIKRLKGD